MDIDKKLLGNRIKSIRLSLGVNMREFGERIGNKLRETSNLSDELDPSDSIVSRWEKGVSMPSPDRLKAIADLGNISVDELLYGTPEQHFFKLIASIVTKKYDSGISPVKAMKIKKELEEQGLVDIYSHTPESIHSLYYDYFEKVFKKENIINTQGFERYVAVVLFNAFNKIYSGYNSMEKEEQDKNKQLLSNVMERLSVFFQ